MARRVERPVVVSRTQGRRTPKPTPRERAEQLHAQGMPFQLAMAVAHGRIDLSTALERLATQEKVERLMERHDLSRALATQIAIGHASLDQVLARRRMQSHRDENRHRSILVQLAESGEPLALALHQGQRAQGTVQNVERYAFEFLPEGFDEPVEIHKLQVKYAYRPEHWKQVRKALSFNKKLERSPLSPESRPQDRFSLADKRLFQAMDGELEVEVTLLEGEVIRGKIRWFGRWEFGIEPKTGGEIVVFRHALAGFSTN
jgi:sRNA-binding regulator protein Hfq